MSEKNILILEQSSEPISLINSKTYTYKGIFAELKVKNRNKRFYTNENYMPHIEALKEQIKTDGLLGELDHPERFDVKSAEASHIIEDLWVEKGEDGIERIMGKLRLLSTSKGKEARALFDDGVKLRPSSRAGGTVLESGQVKLKKIFTFDLVPRPGFQLPTLQPVTESLGFETDNDFAVFEMAHEKDFNWDEIKTGNKTEINNKKLNEDMEKENEKYVSENEMQAYSTQVSERITALEKQFEQVVAEKNKEIEKLTESVNLFEQYSNYLSNHVEKAYKDFKSFSETRTKGEKTIDIKNDVEKLKNYVQYLGETFNENVKEVSESFEKQEKYNDYVAENVNDVIGYNEYIAENVENVIGYNNYVAENMNDIIGYNEYVAENVGNVIKYNEYIAEGVNSVIGYNDYLAENMQLSIEHSDYIAEHLKTEAGKVEKISEGFETVLSFSEKMQKQIDESENFGLSGTKLNDNLKLIEESISSLVDGDGSKMKSVNEAQEDFPEWMEFLSESAKSDWQEYPNKVKLALESAFDGETVVRKGQAKKIWESVLSEFYNWEEMVPESMKPVWESLSPAKKDLIRKQASNYNLLSESKIEDFWETRNLKQPGKATKWSNKISKINESVENDRKSQLIKQIKRFKK